MALSREEIIPGLVEELESFGELLRSLGESEWEASTRCEGWRVADVAAHAVGNITYIVEGRVAEMADPNHVNDQVDDRRGKTAAELADELDRGIKGARDLIGILPEEAWAGPAGPGFEIDLREGVEAIWYDTYMHGDDIRAATGRDADRGPGLRCSIHHVATILGRNGWGPVTLALEGVEEVPVGDGGERVDDTVNIYRP
jgi:uncharacterized protein (TIGR03083 family)